LRLSGSNPGGVEGETFSFWAAEGRRRGKEGVGGRGESGRQGREWEAGERVGGRGGRGREGREREAGKGGNKMWWEGKRVEQMGGRQEKEGRKRE